MCQLMIWCDTDLCQWNNAINSTLFIWIYYRLIFIPWPCFLCCLTCFLAGRPTCCWTGAVQKSPQWGRWVIGWMEWEPCPARRPSLGSATAPATPWPRPLLSKATTDTHSKLPCLFMSGVFTGSQYPWQGPGIWRDSWWRHTLTHIHTLLFSVSTESYRALTKGVQIRDMVIHSDRPLATLSVLQTMTTEGEGESFKRKRNKKRCRKKRKRADELWVP